MKTIILTCLLAFTVLACVSKQEQNMRLIKEDQIRKEKQIKEDQIKNEILVKEKEAELELEKKAKAIRLEKEKQEKADKIKQEAWDREQKIKAEARYRLSNNSLQNGSTPYENCFGSYNNCGEEYCSEITVITSNSDVLVTIKKGEKVYRHAYIKASNSFTFYLPNGTYQPFFYYGKGWDPDKKMKSENCADLKGGFVHNENFGKDSPQYLFNNRLSYQLILQQNGNFSTKPSNQNEAL